MSFHTILTSAWFVGGWGMVQDLLIVRVGGRLTDNSLIHEGTDTKKPPVHGAKEATKL